MPAESAVDRILFTLSRMIVAANDLSDEDRLLTTVRTATEGKRGEIRLTWHSAARDGDPKFFRIVVEEVE